MDRKVRLGRPSARVALVIVEVTLLCLLFSGLPATSPQAQEASAAGSNGFVELPGHVVPALVGLQPVPSPEGAAAQTMVVTVILRRTDEQGFATFADAVNDPHSSLFRQFVSQAELTGRFGPSQAAYNAVRSYLLRSGLEISQESANRLTLTAKGSRAQVESAFRLHINDYRMGDRTFY